MRTCTVPGCARKHYGKDMCFMHYQRVWRTGITDLKERPPMVSKYRHKSRDGRTSTEHIFLAEQAIGKKLPAGAEVHHVDSNGLNNAPTNLVICQDHAYHMLLHRRQRSLDACGNANFLKCHICKQYDLPDDMYIRKDGKGQWHRKCGNRTRLERKRRSK